MTYLFFVNGTYWDSTRDNSLAFAWLKEWQNLGHQAGLKFVKDNDEEVFRWLVPPEAMKVMEVA
jgi:hypothetical protein